MNFVKYEKVESHIVIITINRPERLNALGSKIGEELEEAFCNYQDDDDLRAAIITGAGKAFCAGVDVKEWAEIGAYPSEDSPRRMFFNFWGTPNLSKPVIAAVKGYCYGAGINRLLLRCDIRVAGEGALFGMPEVERGLMDLATPLGSQNIPTCFIAELFYTADPVNADRALQFGMINMVVPDDQVMTRALEIARRIARHASEAVQYTKRNLLRTLEPKESAFVWEQYYKDKLRASSEAVQKLKEWAERGKGKK